MTNHRVIAQVHLLYQLFGLIEHFFRIFQGEKVWNDMIPDSHINIAELVELGQSRLVQGLSHPSLRNLATASLSSIGISRMVDGSKRL